MSSLIRYRMAECTNTQSRTSSDGNQLSSESGVVACVSVTADLPADAVSGAVDEARAGREVPVMNAIMSAIETAGTLIATDDLPCMQALTSAPSSP